ncbi:DUF6188 family protein [Kribbella sp. NPDC051587]|uniref:DUF6188 family protein n=1 Tax=Kribbella sp. NPDC051587 TaxID=3364119 RepID=UPI0037986CCB
MTYYRDLSPYEYGESDRPMVNVGWLGRGREFPTGPVAPTVVAGLARLAVDERNVYRGWHECEFCDAESPIEFPGPEGSLLLGHAEVHITGPDGVVYAAPTLILHYIEAHEYRPPTEFLSAVAQMTEGRLVERGDRWELPMGGRVVEQCLVDHAFSLRCDEAHLIRIEGPMTYWDSNGWPHQVDPDSEPVGMGVLLQLLRRTVVSAEAAGGLQIEFDDQSRLQVEPDDYEAWSYAGPDGMRVVSLPGGDLAIWQRKP